MKSVSYAQVAKNLDIPLGTLYGWLEKVKKPSSPDFKTDNLISSKALLEENKR
jgi:transposase